jgi:hypothetical protein
MIPFAIQDFIVPFGLALAPFGRKVAGQSSSQISRALRMIIGKFNYIIIHSEVNAFVFERSFFFDMMDSCINLLIGFSDVRAS